MIRVILAPNDLLTPIDLRAKTSWVNVKFFTYYHEQKVSSRKVSDIFQNFEFFSQDGYQTTPFQKFFEPKSNFQIFFSKLYFRKKSAGLDLTPIII